MRDFKTSIYTKAIAIDPEDLSYLDKVRGKKSKAGKLKEIIEFYKQNHLWLKQKFQPSQWTL